MMRKVLEYTKKMALVRKLFRQGLISDQEYKKITRKLKDAYMIINVSKVFLAKREIDFVMIISISPSMHRAIIS